ncbi:hypothetical protein TRIUR3_32975 [Triticum urartu]|uniref:Uncharacterized protein n=1 Tax=Triticum urartu TaxID=4572 RepID=M7YGT0_TRIUA|nr:hypothetical protein TRIUR3_32975 [Triticum urartu]
MLWAVLHEAFNCSNVDIYGRLAIGKSTALFLCEEWTATPVCEALGDIADVSVADEKQQMKALFENVGSSMCSDHCDWFGNSGLEAMSRNADTLPVIHFLQLRPTNYEIKKLQVNEFVKIARAANIHAYIIFQLKNDITAMTGKAKAQRRLIDSLHDE